jgi:hypothetical protein
MKNRFWLIIATFASCLLLSGAILSNSPTTIRAAAKARADSATTVAKLPQECAQCESKCKAWMDKCKEGGQYACYKAAACLCKCNLDAGGCGSSKEALKECYEQNEKSAKELESPGQQ